MEEPSKKKEFKLTKMEDLYVKPIERPDTVHSKPFPDSPTQKIKIQKEFIYVNESNEEVLA